jgi:hypothetical protein
MVRRTWFRPAVRIVWGRGILYVDSLQRAAEILMSDDWEVHGPACERAAQALIDALGGKITPDEARDAFRDAAEEARILVK